MALSDLIDLGTTDDVDAAKRIPLATFKTIKADLDKELQNSFQNVERKNALLEGLDNLRKAKFIERGKQNTDSVFQHYQASIVAAKNLIN